MPKSRNKATQLPVTIYSYAYTVPHRKSHHEMVEEPALIRPDNSLLAILHFIQEKCQHSRIFFEYNPKKHENLIETILKIDNAISNYIEQNGNEHIVNLLIAQREAMWDFYMAVDRSHDVRTFLAGSGELEMQRKGFPFLWT